MAEKKKKDSLLSQILAAVVIALLAGGTAPWWWSELKGVFTKRTGDSPATSVEKTPAEAPAESLRRALEDYEAVHALYGQSRPAGNCVEVRRIVEQIRLHVGNQRLVPESFRYTVRYPAAKAAPTISDLAVDRITRIKMAKSQCFDKEAFTKKTGGSPATSVEKPPPDEPSAESPKSALEDYEAVQALYGRHKLTDNCAEVRRIVEQIRLHAGDQRLDPEGFRYTVKYPAAKAAPTISDLAIDRITRIKKARSQCFDKEVFTKKTGDSPATSVEKPPPAEPPAESPRSALEDYEAVQALYGRHKLTDNCAEVRRIVEQIRLHAGNQRLVPESFRHTVEYPAKKLPTISDLATDRINRIKKARSQCFD